MSDKPKSPFATIEDQRLHEAFVSGQAVKSSSEQLRNSLIELRKCNREAVSESEKLARSARQSRSMMAVKPPEPTPIKDALSELTGRFIAIKSMA